MRITWGIESVGVDCRGREHEITLLWSLVSGKAHLTAKEFTDTSPPPTKYSILSPPNSIRGSTYPTANTTGIIASISAVTLASRWVGEHDDLIDFGDVNVSNAARGVSQIAFTQQFNSDVSVLEDDDATTISFMVPIQSSGVAGFQQQHFSPPVGQPYQKQPSVQPTFCDPTYNSYSSASTPRPGGFNDAASFAFAPPPTWDDYINAFGGNVPVN
ncbi:hypothetical protein ACHAW6_015306 [Cyclotella cf. meneghiniana]